MKIRGGHMPDKHENSVQSIERALDIIESLSSEEKGLGVTEIADRVGLHKSTVHRLLATLNDRGYVEKNEEGSYQIGLKLIEVVSFFINSLELQTEARPHVAQISTELGLTSHLGVLDGDQVVYIERMDVYSGVKLYSQIGLRVHAYCSSLGKCLLSNFSKEELYKIMRDCSFTKFTENTISSLDELYEELKDVRKKGYGMDNQEFDMNNRCIGAPIYDYKGEIIAAISASGPPNLLTEERIPSVSEYVMKKAGLISRSMGYLD